MDYRTINEQDQPIIKKSPLGEERGSNLYDAM